MPKAKNKTVQTDNDPVIFLRSISPVEKQNDCFALLKLMREVSNCQPKMWGKIVGFGTYHYKYESGREGDSLRIGFSPRAQNISVYIMPGFEGLEKELAALGKHKLGKSCLYIKRLSDVDIDVLRTVMSKSLAIMAEKYPQ